MERKAPQILLHAAFSPLGPSWAEINVGAVKTLQAFIDNNKSEIARFITDQIKAWDVDRMIDIIELNIGRDLQYIRLNGTFVGGLAGLILFAAERAAQLK